MRRFFKFLIVAAAIICGIMVFAPEILPTSAVRAESDFDAARMLLEAFEEGRDTITFRTDSLNQDNIFRTLEATLPYAFSMHCTTRRSGTMTIRIESGYLEAQKQAQLLAQGIAGDLVTHDMTAAERLLVLHDYLVQVCQYDTETAGQELVAAGSGIEAPFTAAGALVDGRAVCAGYARAYMMLCNAAGIDMIYITDTGMNHGWNAVRIYDEIYYIDVTFDDPVPDRGQFVSHEYFMKSEAELSATHRWDKAFYEDLMDYVLPQTLADMQRLYDLGLIDTPAQLLYVTERLPQADRTALAFEGVQADEELPAAAFCSLVWEQICADNGLLRELIARGEVDGERAALAGFS